MLEFIYRTDYSQQQIEDMEQEKKFQEEKKKQQDEDDYAFFEEHYDQGHDDGGQQIKYLERSLKEYRNTGKIEYYINNYEEDHEEQVEEFKKINPQELKTLIELTDKLDNTFGYDYGSYKDYGEKVYKDTLKSKKELYDYAKSINVDIDKLTGTQSSAYDTIDNLIPDLDL